MSANHGQMRVESHNETSGARVLHCDICDRHIHLYVEKEGVSYDVIDQGDFYATHSFISHPEHMEISFG